MSFNVKRTQTHPSRFPEATRLAERGKVWRQWTATSLLLFLVGSHVLSAYLSYLSATSYRRIGALRSFELGVTQAFTSLAVAESAQRGYATANLAELRNEALTSLATTRLRLRGADDLSKADPVLRARFVPLEAAFSAKMAWMDRVMGTAQTSSVAAAASMIRTGQGKRLMDDVEAQMRLLEETDNRMLGEQNSRVRLYGRVDVASSILFVVISLVLSATLFRLWARIAESESEVAQLRAERTADLEQEVSRRTAQLQLVNGDLEAFSSVTAQTVRRELEDLAKVLAPAEGKPLSEESLSQAQAHIDELRQTLGLVQQLSRLSRERAPAEPVDLAEMLRAVVEAKQASQPLPALRLSAPDHLPAFTNERGMRILFRSLIDSAWPHMMKEMSPTVELAADESDGRRVFALRYGSSGQVPVDLISLLTTSEDSGDRLLSIAAAIAERVIQRIGGELWVDSVPGRRTSFYFTLGD
jgi:CHASE3 domain sensor protein/HPt (histidine-containing phosphotransfer) domain-containing protein